MCDRAAGYGRPRAPAGRLRGAFGTHGMPWYNDGHGFENGLEPSAGNSQRVLDGPEV